MRSIPRCDNDAVIPVTGTLARGRGPGLPSKNEGPTSCCRPPFAVITEHTTKPTGAAKRLSHDELIASKPLDWARPQASAAFLHGISVLDRIEPRGIAVHQPDFRSSFLRDLLTEILPRIHCRLGWW